MRLRRVAKGPGLLKHEGPSASSSWGPSWPALPCMLHGCAPDFGATFENLHASSEGEVGVSFWGQVAPSEASGRVTIHVSQALARGPDFQEG